MSAALSGVRVVDLTHGVAGAVAGMLLSDYGADVVVAAAAQRRPNDGFAIWDRGKRVVSLDVESPKEVERVSRLVGGADVVLVRDAPGEGLHAKLLADAARGQTIVVRMTATLGDIRWAGGHESNELLSASMGLSRRQSSFEGGPVDPVAPQLLYMQGAWAAACAVAALIERLRTAQGQSVIVSGAHAAVLASNATMAIDPQAGEPDTAVGPGGPSPFYSRYQCGDGEWVFIGALTPKFQHRALQALRLTGLLNEPLLAAGLGAALSAEASRCLRKRIAAVMRLHDRQTWLQEFEKVDCPAGPVLRRDDWLEHPQVIENDLRIELDDPIRGRVVMPGAPLQMSRTPAKPRRAAPPTRRAASWPASSRDDAGSAPMSLPAPRTADDGPLSGFTVLDLGSILAGPLTGSLLSDLGANVVKVEPPDGDSFRVTGFMHNRGMRSVSIDLRSPQGLDAFYELVRNADVVIDNYRSGVVDRLRIDHASLAVQNPRIITMSIRGFGSAGALVRQSGFDPVLQAMSGMMSAQGGDDEPVLLTLAINDVTSAALSAVGIVLALYHRCVADTGQHVETSLLAASTFMQSGELTQFPGRQAARTGGRDFMGPGALDRFYRVADGWIRIQTESDRIGSLIACGLVSHDPHDDALLADLLEQSLSSRRVADLLRILAAASIPAAPARTILNITEDRGLLDARLLQRHEFADGRPYFTAGTFAQFDRHDSYRVAVPPGLGEHSRAILDEAGVPPEAVERLIEANVIRTGGPLVLSGFASYR